MHGLLFPLAIMNSNCSPCSIYESSHTKSSKNDRDFRGFNLLPIAKRLMLCQTMLYTPTSILGDSSLFEECHIHITTLSSHVTLYVEEDKKTLCAVRLLQGFG